MTTPEAGRRQRRPVDGILVLDKPAGLTSNAALQRVKFLYGADKAGHTGALDPLATGVLPLCFGEATKFSQYLLDADKVYRAEARLGVTTDSGDSDGQVLAERPVPALDEATVMAVLARHTGDIEQVPPMYSALKRDGRPLYELARKGISVERAPRRVHVSRLDLLELAGSRLVIEAAVSKGTYIRTLVEDIGEALGCGAHVTALRRLAAGHFSLAQAFDLATLEQVAADGGTEALDALLQPTESALAGWPEVILSPESAYYMRRGQAVRVPGNGIPGNVAIYEDAGQGHKALVGIGEFTEDGRLAPRRLLNTGAGAG